MNIFESLTKSVRNGQRADLRLRFAAAALHFSGTVVVGLFAFLLIRLVWYPDFFWQVAGGSELFLLLCSVDAVLGPVLTFAVFNPAKGLKRLRFDLIAIIMLQLVAFGYGLWTTASARPLFLVYSVDRFDLVTAISIDGKDLAAAEFPQFRSLSWSKPQIIGTREPKDFAEKSEFIDSALAGRDRHLLPKTYVPFEQVRAECVSGVQPLTKLTSTSNAGADLIRKSEVRLSMGHAKLGFVPVIAKGEWVMIVDATTCELLEAVAVSGF